MSEEVTPTVTAAENPTPAATPETPAAPSQPPATPESNAPTGADNVPPVPTPEPTPEPVEPAAPNAGEPAAGGEDLSDEALRIWAERVYGKDSDMYQLVTKGASAPTITGPASTARLEPIQEIAMRAQGFSQEAIEQAPQVVQLLKSLGFVTVSDTQRLSKDVSANMFFESNPEAKTYQKDINYLIQTGRAKSLEDGFAKAKQLFGGAVTPPSVPAQTQPVTPPTTTPGGGSAPAEETPADNFAWKVLGKI